LSVLSRKEHSGVAETNRHTTLTRGWGIWLAWERRGRCCRGKIRKKEVTGDLSVDGR